ncbi:MAG TPA: metallophosphoesterase family protein, partial [Candidatus Limnocylindrales bacterium]
LELVSALAPTEGVAGNNDAPELVERLGLRRVVAIAGVRIGLTHGHLGPGRTSRDRAMGSFAGEAALDAIVFGHSHVPLVERQPDGQWVVNPGSPTDRRRQPRCTWALMTIEAGRVAAVELVGFDRR